MPTAGISAAEFRYASDQSLLIYFGHSITLEAHRHVARLLRLLELEPALGVRNLHPGYCSLLVKFDGLHFQHEEIEATLRSYIYRLDENPEPAPRSIEIPVCYGGEFGPDLNDVAEMRGLTTSQTIELHASSTYLVYFVGFIPGFAYLGEVPESLVTPRLATPRTRVPAGSVGIAGKQTGIYPFATPGGWRLLGRTTVSMFQPARAGMTLLSIGDRVRFLPISREQFAILERS